VIRRRMVGIIRIVPGLTDAAVGSHDLNGGYPFMSIIAGFRVSVEGPSREGVLWA